MAQQALKVGDYTENISLMNVDNKMYSLDAQKNAKGFILIFMSVSCDHCIAYKDRLQALDRDFKKQGYPLVAISPFGDNESSYPLDAMPAMKAFMKSEKLTFPYLSDQQFKYAHLFGVQTTPTAVILQRKGKGYQLKYQGPIDDNTFLKKAQTKSFLREQLKALLKP